MQAESQNEKILEYFKAGNKLSPLEALDLFGCFRLGARVWELKKAGHHIEGDIVRENEKHFAVYWMPEYYNKDGLIMERKVMNGTISLYGKLFNNAGLVCCNGKAVWAKVSVQGYDVFFEGKYICHLRNAIAA